MFRRDGVLNLPRSAGFPEYGHESGVAGASSRPLLWKRLSVEGAAVAVEAIGATEAAGGIVLE